MGDLGVGDGHVLHYEVHGNPAGKPAVYLHGGPGAGLTRSTAGLFNPERYRVLLFDQRGCGRSTPYASLEHNTTWHLVADLERLREHLGVDRWLVCGGSWGSTLALAYAQHHPERVTELVLRGIFLCRRAELKWFYQEGASWLNPVQWEKFIAPLEVDGRRDIIAAYHRHLTGSDLDKQMECARAWSLWEGSMLELIPDPERIATFGVDEFALAFACIESHYFVNGAFLEPETVLLDNAGALADIPGVIVHGRHDEVTPFRSAWQLHKAWPNSELQVIPDAGHAVSELGISKALVAALDRFAT